MSLEIWAQLLNPPPFSFYESQMDDLHYPFISFPLKKSQLLPFPSNLDEHLSFPWKIQDYQFYIKWLSWPPS